MEPIDETIKNIDFDNLKNLSDNELIALGLRKWDPDEEDMLWLFPLEFYDYIPPGFAISWIDGDCELFSGKGEEDKDTRYGMLAFGVRKPHAKS